MDCYGWCRKSYGLMSNPWDILFKAFLLTLLSLCLDWGSKGEKVVMMVYECVSDEGV